MFSTRYLDLFVHYVSLYNSFMKIIFLGSSYYILYLMKVRFKASWDPNLDTFQIRFILLPCAVLSLLITYSYSLLEVILMNLND